MAKKETLLQVEMTKICAQIFDELKKKKNHPEPIFQDVFLVADWKLPALQGVWVSLMKREAYTDRGLGNLREAEHLLKTSVSLICSDASDRALLPFSHIRNASWGDSGLYPSCDICLLSLPFIAILNSATCLSRISKIHLLSATSWANSCWHWLLHSLRCCFPRTWFSESVYSLSQMLCRLTLGRSCSWPVQHTHSNIITCRCQTHWKVNTSMQGGWVGRGLGLAIQKTASSKKQN